MTLPRRFRLRPAGSTITGSNLLQAAVTVVVALAVAAAALISADAAGRWQTSLRQEIKRSAAMLEDVRHVYGTEGPAALEHAFLQARAGDMPDASGEASKQVADALGQAYEGKDHLVSGNRYALDGGGYAVQRRLGDIRRRNADLAALDPSGSLEAGDRARRRASVLLVLVVPVLALYLAAELVLRARARRRTRSGAVVSAAGSADDVGLVPRPWSSSGGRRAAVTVAFCAWLAVTLLPVAQIALANAEQRAQALAARKAAEASTALGASGLVRTFQVNSLLRAESFGSLALGREYAATLADDPATAVHLQSEAAQEQEMAGEARAIAASMARPPTPADGVDHATAAAVSASGPQAAAIVEEQNLQADRAEIAGRRSGRITLALLLAALSVSLAALAATGRARGTTVIDWAAGAVLAGSLAAAVSVLAVG